MIRRHQGRWNEGAGEETDGRGRDDHVGPSHHSRVIWFIQTSFVLKSLHFIELGLGLLLLVLLLVLHLLNHRGEMAVSRDAANLREDSVLLLQVLHVLQLRLLALRRLVYVSPPPPSPTQRRRRLRLPNTNVGVIRPRQHEPRVRREVHAEDALHALRVVTASHTLHSHSHFAAVHALHRPDPQRAVVAARHELAARAAVRHGQYRAHVVRVRRHRLLQVAHVERVQVVVLVRLRLIPRVDAHHREVHGLTRVPRQVVRDHAELNLAQNRRGADVVQDDATLAGGGGHQARLRGVELRAQNVLRLVGVMMHGLLTLGTPDVQDGAACDEGAVDGAVVDGATRERRIAE